MLGLLICLAVFCLILLLVLIKQDDKNTKLAAENGLMRGRIETLQERGVFTGGISPTANAPLTVEDVETVVRCAGYVPYTSDSFVLFKVVDRQFSIMTSRLPQLLISLDGIVQTSEWDMELLQKAAQQASDSMIMLKAIFDEESDCITLHLCVAIIERSYSSLRDNLMIYIDIISEGTRRIHEIYNQLVDEKKTMTPFTTVDVQDKKLPS